MSGGVSGADAVAMRLEAARNRIRRACAAAGKNADDVAVLAVTKGFGTEAIEAALAAELRDIGENYYQEAAAKFAPVSWPPKSRRHFIGRVQRNKARHIAALFDVVQAVDRAEVAEALDRGAAESGKALDVLLQVNIAADDRAGVAPDAAMGLAHDIRSRPHLRLRGVMAVGPLDPAQARPAFARAADVYRRLRDEFAAIDILSLGMTGDLETAVAAGSTMVRLGTALFGPRPQEG